MSITEIPVDKFSELINNHELKMYFDGDNINVNVYSRTRGIIRKEIVLIVYFIMIWIVLKFESFIDS